MTWLLVRSFIRAYWLPMLIAIVLGSWSGYMHHSGYEQGKKKADSLLSGARNERDLYKLAADGYANVVAQMQAAQDAQKAAADAQAKAGKDALAQAHKAAQAHDKALTSALDRYRHAKPVSCRDEALPDGVL